MQAEGSVAHRQVSLPLFRWLLPALLLVLLLLATNAVVLALLTGRPYTVDAGTYGDQLLLKGFYAQESNAAGQTYRWTGQRSALLLRNTALTPQVQLSLLVGGIPAGAPQPLPTSLEVNGRAWGTLAVSAVPRRYALLLPSAAGAGLEVAVSTPLTSAPDDPRALGLRLDAIELRLGRGLLLPTAAQLLAQLACLLLLAVTLRLLHTPPLVLVGSVLIATLGLALLQALALPLVALYLPRLAAMCAVLALLTVLVLPWARRLLPELHEADLRWLWGVALLACALRMAAMLYPPFATHDLPLNLKRLDAVAQGTLVLIAPSTEFADELTIYPPAPYIVLLPSYLLIENRQLVLMFGIPLIDGSSALLTGLLALHLGAGRLAARMAALLYAGSSLSFTALWWGFTAQAFGQWLMVPLALALMATLPLQSPASALPARSEERRHAWLVSFLLFEIALLTHAGVAVLAVVWVTLILGLIGLRGRVTRAWWQRAAIFYLGSGMLAFVLLYADVVALKLNEMQEVGQTITQDLFRGMTPLFLKGTLLAYTPVGLLLVPLGLWLLLRRMPSPGPRAVIIAWVVTVLLFIVVDLVFGLIVRHLYFMLPLACAATGYALSALADQVLWRRVLAWGVVALYAAHGLVLWWMATVEYIKPTMAPLTH